MKRFALFLIVALLSAVACEPKEPEETISLSVSPTEISFQAHDTSIYPLVLKTNGTWNASTDATWVHVDPVSGKGNSTISLTADDTDADRSAEIVFTSQLSGKQEKATVTVKQRGSGKQALVPSPAAFDGTKRASTTYQLLIYSFADSNGDGIGDFKGIQNKLDYLEELGASALWLSPAHPASSYHAYDVTDYYSVNPLYGTEQDFKDLLAAAHSRGISIYMDYVLDHSSKYHPWFQEALADPSSKYRDYYFICSNPSSEYKNYPMLKGSTYNADEWKQVTSGSPKLTITSTTEAVTKGSSTWNMYMWQDGIGDKTINFVDKGDGTLYLVTDIAGKWGMLVRKYADWSNGSKFGAKNGVTTLQAGTSVDLVAEGSDMWFTGSGRYKIELTNVSTETLYYMGCFSDWMPDLNYGDVSVAENNACFKDLAASADKWIKMGVDGFRLDAVKHICGGIWSYNNSSNITLMQKWYDHCNTTYKAAGNTGNIFMVGEVWDGHGTEKTYYKGLTSCFEFDFGYKVRDILKGNGSGASSLASTVSGFITDHLSQRSDAITSMFLSNHDQNRFASEIGKSVPKEKQAAAILLTVPGKPFVYQGEELGYWGVKDSGDEYVRAPMMWDKAGKECAKKGVNNKVDNNMLKAENSVEAQEADPESILNVYKTFSKLRNTYPALASGTITPVTISSFAAWKMSDGSQTLLVIHNMSNSEKSAKVSDSMEHPVAVLGSASVLDDTLYLDAFSSVVFQL
ncbi:MAG: hypothetical protein IKZ91_02770 [Bacteroidales bacterium]|nr:hypothetical protein [Bacteroidales bacterium]